MFDFYFNLPLIVRLVVQAGAVILGLTNSPAFAARSIFFTLFAGTSVYIWRRAPGLATRAGLGAMLVLGAILAGPAAHHNYHLWWLPFYCVTLAAAL